MACAVDVVPVTVCLTVVEAVAVWVAPTVTVVDEVTVTCRTRFISLSLHRETIFCRGQVQNKGKMSVSLTVVWDAVTVDVEVVF